MTKITIKSGNLKEIEIGEHENISREISLDNGNTFMSADAAMPQIEERGLWDTVTQFMDDDVRESVHDKLAPCTDKEFLKAYLQEADEDLIIG